MPYMMKDMGFECACFGRGEEITNRIKSQVPKLVIVDVTSAYESGEAVLSKVRELCRPKGIPIVIISIELMRLEEFDSAREVILYKPINVTKITRAVNEACAKREKEKRVNFEDIALDSEARSAMICGDKVELTAKEFELLHILAANPGRVYTREQLFTCLWESSYMGKSRTVDVHLGNLRAKLGNAGGYIKTVRGKGYCLSK